MSSCERILEVLVLKNDFFDVSFTDNFKRKKANKKTEIKNDPFWSLTKSILRNLSLVIKKILWNPLEVT